MIKESILLTDEILDERSFTDENKGRFEYASIYTAFVLGILFFVTLFILYFAAAKPWNTESIIFVNDIHIDWKYVETGTSENNEVCHIPGNRTASKFGRYWCDTPYPLWESMVRNMKKRVNKPNMIIMGGDTISYTLYPSVEDVANTTAYIYNTLHEAFPKTPIYSILGNNEFVPNYGYYHNATNTYKSLSKSLHIEGKAKESFENGGYYYIDVPSQNIRYIFMNTVIYNGWHNYTNPETGETLNVSDPFGQLEWLNKTLLDAASKKLKAGLVMHIPSGVSYWGLDLGWVSPYHQRFFEIISKRDYEFILCGHTHVDLLLPMFNDEGRADAIAISSTSVSPQHENNPGYRIIQATNGYLVDYAQIYADLMINHADDLDWREGYRFGDLYRQKDLRRSSIQRAVEYIRRSEFAMERHISWVNARARAHKNFYYCVLSGTSEAQVRKCMGEHN